MAQSFLSSLPKSLRSAWSIVTKGVREGLTANRIQSVLQTSGLGVRRQTLLDGIRAVKHGFAQQKTLRILRTDVLPPLRMIPKALTKITRRFSYNFEVEGRVTGRLVRRFVALSTDERLSAGEAGDEIARRLRDDHFSYGETMDITSIVMTSMLRSGVLGTL